MPDTLRSVLLGTSGLGVGAIAALVLSLSRGHLYASAPRLRRTVRFAACTVVLQAAHFAEELATSFHVRFPALLGLSPWPAAFFISFNLFWLAVWALSIPGLAARRRAALFPLWFLAIAGVVNGLGHPLLILVAGHYFPGAITAAPVGVLAAMLLGDLYAITAPAPGVLGRASS
jgi:hypothetical protein